MFPIHFDLTLVDLIRLNPFNLILIPAVILLGAFLLSVGAIKKFA